MVSRTVPFGYHEFKFWVYDVFASMLFAQMAEVIAQTPEPQRSAWLSELEQDLRVHAVVGAELYVALGEWYDGHEDEFLALLAEAARLLAARKRITAEDAAAWIVCYGKPIIWRGRELEETALAVDFAETLDVILRGGFPDPPAGYYWYFGRRSVFTIPRQQAPGPRHQPSVVRRDVKRPEPD